MVSTEEVSKTLAKYLSDFAAQNCGSVENKKDGISVLIKAIDQTKSSDGLIKTALGSR